MPRQLPLNPHTNHPFNLQKSLEGRQDFRWRNVNPLPLPRSPSQEPTTAEPFSSFPRRRESIRVGQSQQVGTTANCRKLPNAYHSVILNGALLHIRQAEDHLTYSSTPDADLTDLLHAYFRLDDNLDAIYTKIAARDDHIAKLIQKYPGVCLMWQPDPWECLVSYICSARAAPTRITHRVEEIATQLGRPLTLERRDPPHLPRPRRPSSPPASTDCNK